MNTNEISDAIRYCEDKCYYSTCTTCKYYKKTRSCESAFIIDLYDIIDTKTLEMNNIINIIEKIHPKYISNSKHGTFDTNQYIILEIFINDQYKLIKKKDYNKTFNKMKERDMNTK